MNCENELSPLSCNTIESHTRQQKPLTLKHSVEHPVHCISILIRSKHVFESFPFNERGSFIRQQTLILIEDIVRLLKHIIASVRQILEVIRDYLRVFQRIQLCQSYIPNSSKCTSRSCEQRLIALLACWICGVCSHREGMRSNAGVIEIAVK